MKLLTFENHEFEGRNNAYLFVSDGDITIVDTGIARPDIRDQLETGLAEHGLNVDDIDRIILTHWHPDHTGLSGDIQARSDATVHVHIDDAPLVQQNDEALQARQRTLFDEWGMPSAALDALRPHLAIGEIAGRPPTVESFSDGDRIDVGSVELEVLATPGHTAGHSCFIFEGKTGREALVGDAVLPKYTPNVGGADVRVDQPLARYLHTLESIIEQNFSRVWPGHRECIDTPIERAREIIDHHRKRSQNVIEILSDVGPADAWTVSSHLFGGLEGIHILHGPGEAYAHLEYLERHGVVEGTPEGYVTTTNTVDLSSII